MHCITSSAQSQTKKLPDPPEIWNDRELSALWQHAVDTDNSRLADACRAAYVNPLRAELPWARLALLIDAHAAAAAGLSWYRWIESIGGWRPSCEVLQRCEVWPEAFYLADGQGEVTAAEAPPTEAASISPDDLLTTSDLCNHFHVKPRTLARWRRNGFPEPLSTETKPHRWVGSQILRYVEQQQVQEARKARRSYKPGRV